MSSSRSAYSAFSEVDDLVSKPVLGSDGAASWQDFKSQHKSSSSTGAAPHLPVKRSDRLGTGLASIADERKHEEDVRRNAGDAPLGSGYTTFKKRGADAEEAAGKKRAKLVAERVRPDERPYFLKMETFEGWKEDYIFTTRDRGTGYYWDGMDGVKKQMGLSIGGGAGTSSSDQAGGGGQDATPEGEEQMGVEKKKRKKKKRKDKGSAARDPAEVLDDSNNPMEQVAAAMRRRNEALRRPPGSSLAAATTTAVAPVNSEASSDMARRLASSGWESAVDTSSGRTYFFNRGTGGRSWTNPLQPTAVAAVRRSTTEPALYNALSSTGNEKVAAAVEMPKEGDTEALPVGWKSAKDPKSGKMYYHHNSGKTSWERPTA